MKTGFWKKYEQEEHNWDFLLDVSLSNGNKSYYDLNAYDFLHGNCATFAQYLNETYGYKIEAVYQRDEDEEDSFKNSTLVHAYCITPEGYYVDIRGICDDWEEFMQEFIDAGLWDNDDYSFERTYDEIPEDLRVEQDSYAYETAAEMDKKYLGFYGQGIKESTVAKEIAESEKDKRKRYYKDDVATGKYLHKVFKSIGIDLTVDTVIHKLGKNYTPVPRSHPNSKTRYYKYEDLYECFISYPKAKFFCERNNLNDWGDVVSYQIEREESKASLAQEFAQRANFKRQKEEMIEDQKITPLDVGEGASTALRRVLRNREWKDYIPLESYHLDDSDYGLEIKPSLLNDECEHETEYDELEV